MNKFTEEELERVREEVKPPLLVGIKPPSRDDCTAEIFPETDDEELLTEQQIKDSILTKEALADAIMQPQDELITDHEFQQGTKGVFTVKGCSAGHSSGVGLCGQLKEKHAQ